MASGEKGRGRQPIREEAVNFLIQATQNANQAAGVSNETGATTQGASQTAGFILQILGFSL
ncbi:MAG: hypothetical protein FJ134_08405 [Deltaproteobacteria bacterium]|nr:hypothetical protein [Deltaproteobacteria bacterium]